MVDIQDGTVQIITDKLVSVCEERQLPMAKITGFGTDGAVVTVGHREGVAPHLKRLNSQLLSVHCGAHRLSLATSKAAGSVSYLVKEFNGHLATTFFYFYTVQY